MASQPQHHPPALHHLQMMMMVLIMIKVIMRLTMIMIMMIMIMMIMMTIYRFLKLLIIVHAGEIVRNRQVNPGSSAGYHPRIDPEFSLFHSYCTTKIQCKS